MTPNNLLSLKRPASVTGSLRRGLGQHSLQGSSLSFGGDSRSVDRNASSLSLASTQSSFISEPPPLKGHHPDPRPSFEPGNGLTPLGSWNPKHVPPQMVMCGVAESIHMARPPQAQHPPPADGRLAAGKLPRRPISASPWQRDADATRMTLRTHAALTKDPKPPTGQVLRTSSYQMQGSEEDKPQPKPQPKRGTLPRNNAAVGAVGTVVAQPARAASPGRQRRARPSTARPGSARLVHSGFDARSNTLRDDRPKLTTQQGPSREIDGRERSLLDSLAHFERSHVVSLDKLLAGSRARTPSPRKPGPMHGEDLPYVGDKERLRYLQTVAPGLTEAGGCLFSAEAPA
eukprot:CAMPEP_0114154248 /NCGR_PEP_ID=MMETSP0043_2-20121206/24799_1 /TAXON_ID=464988 /ORGANISM="Hemiselmis andersenii, Strain CCMP644" /LENGTH=344 /DNA_ID=CAMNT_0001249361 /DNA_START=13 /DNA_END=1047 /DNA_ORIENTATION=+